MAWPVRRRMPVTGHCVALYARILTYVYDNRCTRALSYTYTLTYACARTHWSYISFLTPYMSFSLAVFNQ